MDVTTRAEIDGRMYTVACDRSMRAGFYGLAGFWAWQQWLLELRHSDFEPELPSPGLLKLAISLIESNTSRLRPLAHSIMRANHADSEGDPERARIAASGLELIARDHMRRGDPDLAIHALESATEIAPAGLSTMTSLTYAGSFAYSMMGDSRQCGYLISQANEQLTHVVTNDPHKLVAHSLFRTGIDLNLRGRPGWYDHFQDALSEYGSSLCDNQSGRFFKGLVHLSSAIGLAPHASRGRVDSATARRFWDHFVASKCYLAGEHPGVYSLAAFRRVRLPNRRDCIAYSDMSEPFTFAAREEMLENRKSCISTSTPLFPQTIINTVMARAGRKSIDRSSVINCLDPARGSATLGILARAGRDCAMLGICTWPVQLIKLIIGVRLPRLGC